MEIFLVRHGQTAGNVAHRHQAEDTPLSIEGKQQVRHVADILKQHQPTHLLSSSLVRAIETAAIIGQECDLIPDTSPAFIELARPSHLYGYHHRSLRSIWYSARWYFGSQAALKAEGESYRTLRQRIDQAKHELAQYPADARVVVATHSVFMSFFVEHLCREKPITPLVAVRAFFRILTMKNAYIMRVTYDVKTEGKVCPWSVNGKG